MKLHLPFCLSFLCSLPALAQPAFTTNSLPSQIGEYNSSYYSTNVDVTAMLALVTTNVMEGPGLPGGGTNVAQYWDFSQPEQSYETVLRTDIIAPANGPNSGYFPAATYAEQDTIEPSSQIAWRYYGFTNASSNPGRLYYGFDEPVEDSTAWAVFVPSTTDIPSSVQFGQTWSRALSWGTVLYEYIPISNYFTANATVDAYGYLELPEIGAVPALRVHEVHTYHVTDLDGMIPIDLHTNQYYYWLVPGIGVAAQVFLLGNNVLYPADLPNTNTVLRMYQASYFTNSAPLGLPPQSVNLHIQLQSGSVLLNWAAFTNEMTYRIDFIGSLPNTNWQTLGLSTNTSWSDTLTPTQRFYRVVGIP